MSTASLPDVGESLTSQDVTVTVFARALLPTRFGDFSVVVFRNNLDDEEHVAIVKGTVAGKADVPTRLHSECFTGDVLASLRCDCRQQLEHALERIAAAPEGIVLYMRQEGRGIGLGNKIKAYALQEQGLDTYEANKHLGFDADMRDYRIAGIMLQLLGPDSVRLMTNNPRKVFGLKQAGVSVSQREAIEIRANPHNEKYLDTKASVGGHLLQRED